MEIDYRIVRLLVEACHAAEQVLRRIETESVVPMDEIRAIGRLLDEVIAKYEAR